MFKFLSQFFLKQDKRLVLITKLKKKKLNLYSSKYSTNSIFILRGDITTYIATLKLILKQDILNSTLYVENISKDEFITTTISSWYTSNQHVISSLELLHTYLDLLYQLIEISNKCKNEFNLRRLKPILHSNFIVLQHL